MGASRFDKRSKNNDSEISNEELMEQLRQLKEEVSGLREENESMKKELETNDEHATSSKNDLEDVIDLHTILKKIDEMKIDNSEFLEEDPEEILESPEIKEETEEILEAPEIKAETVTEEFDFDEALSRLEEMAKGDEFATSSFVDNEISANAEPGEIDATSNASGATSLENLFVDIDNATDTIDSVGFEEPEGISDTSHKEDQVALNQTFDTEFKSSVLDFSAGNDTDLETDNSYSSSLENLRLFSEEAKKESTNDDLLSDLDAEIDAALNATPAEADMRNDEPKILDIELDSYEEKQEKLSLTTILADTQELEKFMVESALEAERQRREEAKNFDAKRSRVDEQGNLINPDKMSGTSKIGIALMAAALFVVMFTGKDRIAPLFSDREEPQIELAAETVEVSVGEEYALESGITVSDNESSEAYLMDSLKVDSEPEFDTATVGEYTVTFAVTDESGNATEVTQVVTVVDGEATEAPVEEEPAEEEAPAVEEPKEEEQPAEETSTGDTKPPTVSISSTDVTIAAGEEFELTSGIDASDDVSSSDYLWSHMSITSDPAYDANTPGTYDVTYTFTDEAGNSSSVERIVRVK